MKFFTNEDGSFKAARDDKGHFIKKADALASPEGKALFNDDGVLKGAGGKPVKGYKKQRAMELWAEYAGKVNSRQDWINLFMEKISGMNKGVATVYAHNLDRGKWTV